MAKMIGLSAIDFTMSGVTAPLADTPKNTSAPFSASASVRALVLVTWAGLPLIHALGAALVDHAFGVAQDQVFTFEADRAEKFETGDAGCAGAVADELRGRDIAPGQVEGVEQAGGGDDRGAVLVVVKHRNVEQFAQPLLDDETLRRLDVFEVDAAPRLAEEPDRVDEFVRIFGRDFEIDGVDVGEALEQHGLAFHHRLGGERAEIAKAENGGAVGDDRDEVALGREFECLVLVRGDRQHRHGDARGIGQRQVALGRHGLGGDDFQFSGAALTVKQQRFLFGECRPFSCRLNLKPFQFPEKPDILAGTPAMGIATCRLLCGAGLPR